MCRFVRRRRQPALEVELVRVFDPAAGDLQGRASGFTVGATKNAKGAAGSFDDVVVRVPNPT